MVVATFVLRGGQEDEVRQECGPYRWSVEVRGDGVWAMIDRKPTVIARRSGSGWEVCGLDGLVFDGFTVRSCGTRE